MALAAVLTARSAGAKTAQAILTAAGATGTIVAIFAAVAAVINGGIATPSPTHAQDRQCRFTQDCWSEAKSTSEIGTA